MGSGGMQGVPYSGLGALIVPYGEWFSTSRRRRGSCEGAEMTDIFSFRAQPPIFEAGDFNSRSRTPQP